MFCTKCGIENPENAKFCKKCGTNLEVQKNSMKYYKKKTSKSIRKGISLEGIIIGNVFYFLVLFIIILVFWIFWVGPNNMEKFQASPPSAFEMISAFLILAVTYMTSGTLAGYMGGRRYIHGILNGYLAGLFILLFIYLVVAILRKDPLSFLDIILYGPFGMMGGVLGVFIKNKFIKSKQKVT